MAELFGADLIDRVRHLIDDRVMPYELDDVLLYSFITDAERELARVGRIFRTVASYSINEDDQWVNLESAGEVIEVRKVDLIDANSRRFPMRLIGTVESSSDVLYQDPYSSISSTIVSSSTKGRPNTLVMGNMYEQAELKPISDGPYTLEASLIIYPADAIEDAGAQLSIPQRYHSLVPAGAASMAFDYPGYLEANAQKAKSIHAVWQRSLGRVATEVNQISRDHGPVKFTNDFWT